MESTFLENMILNGSITADKIKVDSRKVSKGDVFVAIKGVNLDGHDFIEEVITKKPALIICEKPQISGYQGNTIFKVPDTKEIMGYLAGRLYNDPFNRLKTYGVTGTNGKTTTVFLIDSILEKAGKKSGFISTIYNKTGTGSVERSVMTTPGILSLYSFLDEMVKKGNDAGIIEISSHALKQRRVCGIKLDVAVFTNITPEHLDYHENMEDYFRYKSKILDLIKPGGRGVLNVDDPLVASLIGNKSLYSNITFGIENKAEINARDIELDSGGTVFTLKIRDMKPFSMKIGLIGKHNVYNVLAAVAAVIDSGVSINDIVSGVNDAFYPPGRLEPVVLKDPFSVFVDYAHTPNALENVLMSLSELPHNKIICVFGCGGDRDRTKRPVMGKIASEYCDRMIITSDNPRSEAPSAIIKDIEKGVTSTGEYSVIEDRKKAIETVVRNADEGDIILIAGKGHEDYQIIGGKTIHFDDKEIIKSVFNER